MSIRKDQAVGLENAMKSINAYVEIDGRSIKINFVLGNYRRNSMWHVTEEHNNLLIVVLQPSYLSFVLLQDVGQTMPT